MAYTKNDPGCYHSLLNYLGEITGQPTIKEIHFKRLTAVKQPGKKLKYKSNAIFIEGNGMRVPYYANNKRFDETYPDLIIDRICVNVNRELDEFGVEIKPAGKYQDSLGGGWHSTVQLIEVNGNFFAPEMECSH